MSGGQARHYWGVDCGSTEIKVALLDASGELRGKFKGRTLFPLLEHVRQALKGDGSFEGPFEGDGMTLKPGHEVIATGYGRTHIPFVKDKLTEIKAHFLGVEHLLRGKLPAGEPYTLIDIGGQDSKVTTIKGGQVHQFVINRKCAAGTGAYIEELAHRLRLELGQLSELARRHDKGLTLNSYCTVFAGQEVIRVLMDGEKVENLIHSLYQSVVKRVLEMTAITSPTIVFSGGVMTHHPILLELFAEKLPGKKVLLAPEAQFCGAIGAALYGLELNRKEGKTQ